MSALSIAGTIGGVALMVAGIVCSFCSLAQQYYLHDELNARLPPGRKFEPTFLGPGNLAAFSRTTTQALA